MANTDDLWHVFFFLKAELQDSELDNFDFRREKGWCSRVVVHVIRCADSRDSEGPGKPSQSYGTPVTREFTAFPGWRLHAGVTRRQGGRLLMEKFELNGNWAPAKAAVQWTIGIVSLFWFDWNSSHNSLYHGPKRVYKTIGHSRGRCPIIL